MKLNLNSYWIRSAFFTVFQRGAMLVFGLGTLMLVVRMVSKSDFGVYALFLQITGILEVSKESMVKNGLIKFLASSDKLEHTKIITSSFIINLLFSIIIIITLIILAFTLSDYWKSEDLQWMFLIYIISTLLLIPFSQFDSIQQGNFDFKSVFYSHFSRRCFNFLCIGMLYIYRPEANILISIALVETASILFGIIVSYNFTKQYFNFKFILDSIWIKKLFGFGKYVFGTNLSAQIHGSIDQLMIGSLISTSSVATYRTATQINNFVEVPTLSIATIMFPQSAKRLEEQGLEAVKYLYEKSVGIILAILIPGLVLISLIPEVFIKIIAGSQYLDAVPILRITLFFCIFLPFARQFGNTLDAIGHTRTNFIVVLSMAILNLFSNYIFITKFGVIGAAFGSLFTQIISFVLTQYILFKILKIKTFNTLLYGFLFYKDLYNMVKSKL